MPHKLVYLADSPGAAGALIDRYDASHDVYVPFLAGFYPADLNGVVHCTACTFGPTAAPYIQTANLPAPNSPNGIVVCALTCLRPWDQSFHPTTNLAAPVPTQFAFAFGLAVGPNSELIITEDPSAGNRSGRGTMWSASYIP